MADVNLARKMRRDPAGRATIINAPPHCEVKSFPGMPPTARSLVGKFDCIQLFVRTRTELEKIAPKAVKALRPDAVLWVSFPKGSSKIQTNLTRDKGWEGLSKFELKWVTLISVDETWSAFCLRPYKPGEARKSFR
jgi:hypothetical protein